jgi:hypothetical protein
MLQVISFSFLMLSFTFSDNCSCDEILGGLLRKCQSDSGRVVLHALTLIETLIKNGSEAIHTQVASRSFLNEIAALTDGSKGFDVQNKSLTLIKQWADGFSKSNTNLPAFQDIYRQLKMNGVVFPETENDAPIFTPSSSSSSGASAASTAEISTKEKCQRQLKKLQQDLQVVLEKIQLYKDLRDAREKGEPLEDVIDFLQQCQPRMNTLIEGGLAGRIDEKTLEECLNVSFSCGSFSAHGSKQKT